MASQLQRLAGLTRGMLLEGGHLPGDASVDLLLIDGPPNPAVRATGSRRPTPPGTGCTLSAAIAALRGRRPD